MCFLCTYPCLFCFCFVLLYCLKVTLVLSVRCLFIAMWALHSTPLYSSLLSVLFAPPPLLSSPPASSHSHPNQKSVSGPRLRHTSSWGLTVNSAVQYCIRHACMMSNHGIVHIHASPSSLVELDSLARGSACTRGIFIYVCMIHTWKRAYFS